MAGKDVNKGKVSEKADCKYGTACYQTNPDHLKRFRHPKATKEKNDVKRLEEEPSVPTKKKIAAKEKDDVKQLEDEPSLPKKKKIAAKEKDDVKQLKDEPNLPKKKKIAVRSLSLNSMKNYIKEKFLVEMPQDFFDFWNFCCTVDKSNPQGIFSELGIHLVGPFDVLSNKLTDETVSTSEALRHWRYYYDPPEFQTIIKKDGKDLYHIGYFRDDPKEMPSVLASNCASKNGDLIPVGDNIFAVLNTEVENSFKHASKSVREHFEEILVEMKKEAKSKKYSLESKTAKTKDRNKHVVAKTFNGFGIVVPYDKKRDVGYRPLPDSDRKLKSILKKIAEAETKETKLAQHDILQEIITNVQFANDEGDCGMGLELGMDLFHFGDSYLHNDILFLLNVAYELLRRPEFGEIIKAHLSDRKKGDQLSIIS